jgi:hypothetical protein
MAAEDEGMDELPPRLAQMFATMDPSTVRSMFPDIADAYTSGAMSHEDAAAAITGRLTRMIAPRPIPDEARVVTDELVCPVHKWLPEQRMADIPQAVWDALNAVLSGPDATPAQRARWPQGLGAVLDADPVVTAKILHDADGVPAFCLAFESEDHARVYTWKTNYHIFYGEGAQILYCQNFEFGGMRLPDNLFHFLRYVTDGKVEAVGGRLRLKEEYETFGCYEPRQGREQDGREHLSEWFARCYRRLAGEVSYQTEPDEGPRHGPACACDVCLARPHPFTGAAPPAPPERQRHRPVGGKNRRRTYDQMARVPPDEGAE